jgi:hypothetical protein
MRSLQFAPVAAFFSIVLAPGPASAELVAEDASLVPLFAETCTRGGVNAEAILQGMAGSPDWTEVTPPTVDLRALEEVPSRLMGGALRRAESTRQWRRTMNGREVILAVATFAERNAYHHACVLFAADIRNAMPYLDAMDDAMRAIDLSGKSTDLPHYREYGNRLADGREAHADIFSRSRALETPRTMHLSIVFE